MLISGLENVPPSRSLSVSGGLDRWGLQTYITREVRELPLPERHVSSIPLMHAHTHTHTHIHTYILSHTHIHRSDVMIHKVLTHFKGEFLPAAPLETGVNQVRARFRLSAQQRSGATHGRR